MNAQQRREKILSTLESQTQAISASQLGEQFNVSRQIIVGDIALLRANNHDIIATNQGYLLAEHTMNPTVAFTGRIACLHSNDQIEQELSLIISNGGQVEDVQVDHPIYGMITAPLKISTQADIDNFLRLLHTHQDSANALSSLTQGIHTHTINCQDSLSFKKIKDSLQEAGILYSDE